MMRTRRLHVRLAYVVRVGNRASIAYVAAPAISVRRGVGSPEVLMRSLSSQCHASRIKESSAFGARHQREDLVLAMHRASTLPQSLRTRKL